MVLIFNGVSMLKESSMLSSWQQEQAPEFLLPDLHNEPVELANPNKKTLVYFFAPWCSVCRVSISNLEMLYKYNPDIDIKAVVLDYQSIAEVEQFAKNLDLTFPILLGNQNVKQAFKVSAYPSYYVLDENGAIEHRSLGYSTALGLYLRSL